MRMATIRFPDDESRTRGFCELMKRVRVVCLPDGELVIPQVGLRVLDEQAIPYRRSGLDHALKALRETAAAPV